MKLTSPGPPIINPKADRHSVLELGLQRITAPQWLKDDDLALFHAHKSATGGDASVCASLPESLSAQQEFVEFLGQHLLAHHGDRYRLQDNTLQHDSGLRWPWPATDLWQASLWIAEDICLLEKTSQGYRMTAASVCSPSNWQIQDKIGKTVAAIHAPVPGYQEQLNARVNRLFDRLPPGRLLLRHNWSLQPGNELNWQAATVSEADFSRPFWRVERQSLLRLPGSGAIVFSIRLFLYEISQLHNSGDFIPALEAQLDNLRQAEKDYKGLASNWWRLATMNS